MACPPVSGAGGLLMANGYSHTAARQQLRDTAEDLGLSADTSYDFYVTAFDTSGNESDPSNVVTVTTDASSGNTGDGTAPTIDRFDATEAGSPNPHANVTVDWAVSDTLDDGSAGNLSSVDVAVAATDGSSSATHPHAASGASASGSDSFEIKWGGGKTYDVTLTVTDRVVRNSLPLCRRKSLVSVLELPGVRRCAENSYARPYDAAGNSTSQSKQVTAA